MISVKVRNILISIFVVVWLTVFNYASLRSFYLQPMFKTSLPKIKFLFPPAGWIMFYSVDDRAGFAQVYGIKNGQSIFIDPHDIIKTRFIGFDMVNRNVLGTVLDSRMRRPFCNSLFNRFPQFDDFLITAVQYSSLQKSRDESEQIPVYQCKQ